MITVECPWCTEPVEVDAAIVDVLSCDGCAVTVEIAPDPVAHPLGRAA